MLRQSLCDAALGIPGPAVDSPGNRNKLLARHFEGYLGLWLEVHTPRAAQAGLVNGGHFQVQRQAQQAFPPFHAQDSCHWPHKQVKLQCRLTTSHVPISMASITMTSAVACGGLGTLMHYWWEQKMIQRLWKTAWWFLES